MIFLIRDIGTDRIHSGIFVNNVKSGVMALGGVRGTIPSGVRDLVTDFLVTLAGLVISLFIGERIIVMITVDFVFLIVEEITATVLGAARGFLEEASARGRGLGS